MMQAQKQLRNFRQRQVNAKRISRQQVVLRKNLERVYYKRLNTLFRRFIRVRMHLYKEYGSYDVEVATRSLNEELFPTTLAQYKKIFAAIYNMNENRYDYLKKQDEYFVFGRSVDIEALVASYFASRQLFLSNISRRMAQRIQNDIIAGRAENLSIREIADNITKKYLPIASSRAILIARTETGSAAGFADFSYHKQLADDTGASVKKQWTAVNDLRTRSAHSAANGQEVLMDEDFIIGGMPMAYVGDPRGGAKNVINCRCVIVYADEQDIVLN